MTLGSTEEHDFFWQILVLESMEDKWQDVLICEALTCPELSLYKAKVGIARLTHHLLLVLTRFVFQLCSFGYSKTLEEGQ